MSEHPLRPLVEPKSIAVVGASAREHTSGHVAVRQALIGGLGGPVFPVNPRYTSILDSPCFPSLEGLPVPAELVVLALGNERIEAALVDAIEQGAKAAVIFASGYLRGDRHPLLLDRLRGIALEAAIWQHVANALSGIMYRSDLPGEDSVVDHPDRHASTALVNASSIGR